MDTPPRFVSDPFRGIGVARLDVAWQTDAIVRAVLIGDAFVRVCGVPAGRAERSGCLCALSGGSVAGRCRRRCSTG